MTSLPPSEDLLELLDAVSYGRNYYGITIWRLTGGEWQVGVSYGDRNSFAIKNDINIADALMELLNSDRKYGREA
jgi:hypothetical protein